MSASHSGLPDLRDTVLVPEQLGGLPIINRVIERIGLDALLEHFIPHTDRRLRLPHARALGVVIRNLVLQHAPLYALHEWAGSFDAALLGLTPAERALLNDDRVGRALERLFHADRASLLTRLVLDAVRAFEVDLTQFHNDSTTVTFAGAYLHADGRAKSGRATLAIKHGHNKDDRPDLKQLLWILTVSADGAVPIAYRAMDGNTNDAITHIRSWEELVALTGRRDFMYVADAKLATRPNMTHIHKGGGRFISVLPANRKEDAHFRDWIATHESEWRFAQRRSSRHPDAPDDVCHTSEAPWPSAEGHRVIWVRSSSKQERDAKQRQQLIRDGVQAIDALNAKLASPRSRIKSPEAAFDAATTALHATRASRYLSVTIDTNTLETIRQEKRGRPGQHTRYRKITRDTFIIRVHLNDDLIERDAASDGCWPLITNDRTLTGADVLAAYKYQPHLEKRHAQLKGTHHVAPVFLRDPGRIEAILFCHFTALLIQALIERDIRDRMHQRGLQQLSMYPEDRGCAAPTTRRILDIFRDLTRHHIQDPHGNTLKTFHPQPNDLQTQILDLLNIPTTTYNPTT
jgi:transposase